MMTMKYFTNDWFFSRLSEEDIERIAEEYWNYIDSIFDELPFTLKILTKSINLHDGIILNSNVDLENQMLEVELFCGNLQSGYFLLKLNYTLVSKDSKNLDQIQKFLELYASEWEKVDSKQFSHKLLLSNESEVQIAFSDVSVQILTKTAEDYKNIKALKKQTNDDTKII